jgi:multidrug resistance efflux pump
MGDLRTTIGENIPLPRRDARRRRVLYFIIAIVLIAAVIYGGSVIKVDRYTLASGYVQTDEYAEVRPPVTGTVSKIYVTSGNKVKAGDLLVQLNAEEEEATLAETRARLSRLQVNLERRKAEMDIDLERRGVDLEEQKREHANNLEIAELQLRNAQTKLELTQELVDKGLKAANNLEDDKLKEQLARVNLTAFQQKSFTVYEELLRRDRDKYNRELAALEEEINAMQDAVRRAEARLRTRQVLAPIDGIVVRYEFVIGELLQPATVIYEIFGGDINTLKLRINERYSTKVAIGQKYKARLNSFRNVQRLYFYGTVQYMRSVIQAEGDATYRVIYCSFDPGELNVPPGATAEARIYYGQSSLWFYLFNIDF